MKELLAVAGVTLAALAVIAVSVGLGHDTTILVSPPEAVVEQFARELAARRYELAMDHLDQDRADQRGAATRQRIRSIGEAVRARAGAINQVEGIREAMSDDAAGATALMTTEHAGEIAIICELVRRAGVWRISNWRVR